MLAELAGRAQSRSRPPATQRRSTTLDTPLVRMYRRSRARGLRPRGETPHHARHLRPQRRLLRRLLPQGPQGPAADPPGLRRGVRAGRPDRRPRRRRARRSSSARWSTIRWRCTWSTSTPSAPTWPASPASACRAASATTGLPIGLQLQAAAACRGRTLLRAAQMFQQATDWHTAQPSLQCSRQRSVVRCNGLLTTDNGNSPLRHATITPPSSAWKSTCSLPPQSKLFCRCSTQFGAAPNTQTCPVCIGMPGSLPVMNREAFELALKTAVALNCEIPAFTKWDRKQYYYPDLPKGYQISQYDLPMSRRRLPGDQRSEGRDSSRSGSASSAPTWKRTPARACTTRRPARPTAAST